MIWTNKEIPESAPGNQALCLPQQYISRPSVQYYCDAPSDIIYQPSVYEFASHLFKTGTYKYLIDIGCGAAHAASRHFEGKQVIGVDFGENLNAARKNLPQGNFLHFDLENSFSMPSFIVRDSIIVCSDVVEHVANPLPLLRSLANLSKLAPYVLVSTPDRERARGPSNLGPPPNPAHVREWSLGEFGRLLASCGFENHLLGHTFNTNLHRWKSTSLAVAGQHVLPSSAPAKRTAALVSCFDEVDIVLACYTHLRAQGVYVIFIDNWSTDGTWQLIESIHAKDPNGCPHIERFPAAGDTGTFQWKSILQRKEQLAATLDYDWFLHHDADELRYSPFPGVSMADYIGRIDALGFNAIDHSVIDFRPISENYAGQLDVANYFHFFEFGRRPGHFQQIKGWKKQNELVDLASSGGHLAQFSGQRVFPLKFQLSHYSIRNWQQAKKKLHSKRLLRARQEIDRYGWHTHLKGLAEKFENGNLKWSAHSLTAYNPSQFSHEYLIERLSSIGLK